MCTRPWILERGYWAQSGYWNLNSVFCVSALPDQPLEPEIWNLYWCARSTGNCPWNLETGICVGVFWKLGLWKLEPGICTGSTNPCTGLLETGICTGMWGLRNPVPGIWNLEYALAFVVRNLESGIWFLKHGRKLESGTCIWQLAQSRSDIFEFAQSRSDLFEIAARVISKNQMC